MCRLTGAFQAPRRMAERLRQFIDVLTLCACDKFIDAALTPDWVDSSFGAGVCQLCSLSRGLGGSLLHPQRVPQ